MRTVPARARSKRLRETGSYVGGGSIVTSPGDLPAHTHDIGEVNQLKTELEKRLLKSIFDENFSVSDALIEVLKSQKINGNLLVTGGTTALADGAIQFVPSAAGGSEYLTDLLDVTITNPLVAQYLRYNGAEWINAAISYNDLIDKPSIPNVPSWALAASKPSYAWSEIGDKPTSYPPSSHTHDYLPSNGKAVDSDKLDGIDSADFARRIYYGATNLNNMWGTPDGFYTLDGALENTPIGTANMRVICIGGVHRGTQMAFDWISNRAFFRRKQDTTIGDWCEFYHTANLTSPFAYKGWIAPSDLDKTIDKGNGDYVIAYDGATQRLITFGSGGGSCSSMEMIVDYHGNMRTRTSIDANRFSDWYGIYTGRNADRLDTDWRCRNLWCGDSDTGLKWLSDGLIRAVANGVDVFGWNPNGFDVFRPAYIYNNATVKGNLLVEGGATTLSDNSFVLNRSSVQTFESPTTYKQEQQQEALLMLSSDISVLRSENADLRRELAEIKAMLNNSNTVKNG